MVSLSVQSDDLLGQSHSSGPSSTLRCQKLSGWCLRREEIVGLLNMLNGSQSGTGQIPASLSEASQGSKSETFGCWIESPPRMTPTMGEEGSPWKTGSQLSAERLIVARRLLIEKWERFEGGPRPTFL